MRAPLASILVVVVLLSPGGVRPTTAAETHGALEAHGGHDSEASAPFVRGTRGGRLLSHGDLALEVTIFERGVPPEFRVFAMRARKAVDPASMTLEIRLTRLGDAPRTIAFIPEGDYLRGLEVVSEPHSFDVEIVAVVAGRSEVFKYSQYEYRVEMTDALAARSGIEIARAEPRTLETTLPLAGRVTLDVDRVAHVVPRLPGVVVEIFKSLGDPVKAGEPLAIIESRAMAEAKATYLAAIKRVELYRSNYEREKTLFEKQVSASADFFQSRQALAEGEIDLVAARQKLSAIGITGSELATLAADTGENLATAPMRAPIDGVVIEKHLVRGEAVSESENAFVVADLDSVYADAVVYARDLARIRIGQTARVRIPSGEDARVGTVGYLTPVIDAVNQSFTARIALRNQDRLLKPGLFVDVEIVESERRAPVTIEKHAVQEMPFGPAVFIRHGEQFEARPVELGSGDERYVEVISGLAPGAAYASRGSFLLKADIGKEGAAHDH